MVLCALAPDLRAQGADALAARVDSIADEYFSVYLQVNPEFTTETGMANAANDRLNDNSLMAQARWQKRQDAWLAALKRIDAKQLAGRPQWATYGIMRDQFERAVVDRVCRHELWPVNSYVAGWQAQYTDLARLQPVGSDTLRAQAVARLRALPSWLDTEVANLKQGLSLGYSSPKVVVNSVVRQLDAILATPVAESPFASPAQRDSTPAFRAEMLRAIERELNPAIKRYRDYLQNEYLPRARTKLGVSANPDGLACYRADVRQFSTVDRTPDQVYNLGLAQMARIDSQMRVIARESFHTNDVRALLARMTSDPQFTFQTGQELIDSSAAAIARAKKAIPEWFGILPKADVVIEPYPLFRQKAGAPGQYQAQPDDGSRPAIFLINPYDPQHKSRASIEATAFHEGIPGHHLQVSIAKERTGVKPVVRYFFSSGFGEGWALYAEQLADEMGLYSSPTGRLGQLSSDAFRAARLVIDAGIHTKGWSRAQAVKYMKDHTVESPLEIEGEIDRYISWPGQADSYMLGKLEILRLREKARKALGSKFDIRAFHDRVLENGSVTLPMLGENVERWIRAGGGTG